jgi:hypothetical protein
MQPARAQGKPARAAEEAPAHPWRSGARPAGTPVDRSMRTPSSLFAAFALAAIAPACNSSTSILADAVSGRDTGGRDHDATAGRDGGGGGDASANDGSSGGDGGGPTGDAADDTRTDAEITDDAGQDGGSDGGLDDGGSGCHSNADCVLPMYNCYPPGAPLPCGAQPADECQGPGTCLAGLVCVSVDQPCRTHNVCVPACTMQSCMEGFTCGSDGVCQAIVCGNGYTCAPWEICEAGQLGGDAHGCVKRKCARDDQCSGGTCVNDRCESGPGTCALCCPP